MKPIETLHMPSVFKTLVVIIFAITILHKVIGVGTNEKNQDTLSPHPELLKLDIKSICNFDNDDTGQVYYKILLKEAGSLAPHPANESIIVSYKGTTKTIHKDDYLLIPMDRFIQYDDKEENFKYLFQFTPGSISYKTGEPSTDNPFPLMMALDNARGVKAEDASALLIECPKETTGHGFYLHKHDYLYKDLL